MSPSTGSNPGTTFSIRAVNCTDLGKACNTQITDKLELLCVDYCAEGVGQGDVINLATSFETVLQEFYVAAVGIKGEGSDQLIIDADVHRLAFS